ncbi:integrase [Bradyrhizobium yuanmingense]|uniref:tyrosine-type recombinase/integrase n=1 Tax=Bradyrhizobium yuanmingense TaxID=108015 RepID=UPI003519BEC7
MPRHELLSGLVQVYRRGDGRHWHCSASIKGRQYRVTTGEDDLALAKEFAENWYLGLRGKSQAGLLKKNEKTFKQAADQFLKEYEIITEGQRSPKWVRGYRDRLRLHLLPYFGSMGVSEITPGKAQEYRVHRISTSKTGKPPARSTIHDEIVTLRQVLKTAIRHGWLAHLPDFSPPYKSQGKVTHRPWFSPAEYKQLYEKTRAHAKEAQPQHRWFAEQLHDYVLFLGNTGLRPDEAKNLQHRDVAIVEEGGPGERILEIEVRGKRGVGYCKSTPMAVHPYERLLARPKYVTQGRVRERTRKKNPRQAPPLQYPQPTDHVFPGNHIKQFNRLLDKSELKLDRDGKARTAYSLRHTYICMRLMEGADVYQIAKNCRTSVEMIERFYAAHIKNMLDAAAINVMRPKKPKANAARAKGVDRSASDPEALEQL